MSKPKDVLLVNMGDTHSGGSTALFPNYMMGFKIPEGQINHSPTQTQKDIYGHWLKCAEAVKAAGRGKRIVIIHNGDAIEGMHHNSIQVLSPHIDHHIDIHTEIMSAFLKKCGFSKKNGDELNYIIGTESHVSWAELRIAEYFDAKCHEELKLHIHGREIWYTHQGANPGKGSTEGNGFRNWLGAIYWDCEKEKRRKPDAIISSHFHKALYQTFVMDYHTIHGVVLPSWQKKTRYAYAVAPFQRNDIGLSCIDVSVDGDIRVKRPLLMKVT